MKGKAIIINWLAAFALLSYNGESPLIAVVVIGYFAFASWLVVSDGRSWKRI